MRWLMIVLLVSLVALLIAAAGLARHIWVSMSESAPSRRGAGEAPGSDPVRLPSGGENRRDRKI